MADQWTHKRGRSTHGKNSAGMKVPCGLGCIATFLHADCVTLVANDHSELDRRWLILMLVASQRPHEAD